jgi:predicted alpha-1,2-mannosidase
MATSPMNNPGDYTEANAWQYFWTPAQYDVEGMIKLLGGKDRFTAQLDSFFTIKAVNPNKHLGQEAMIGQYAHGNEPSHHIAYLYAFSNSPEKGRELIKQICGQFYLDTPDGMIGNDDCGQMSAWYIFSTLGFYPVNPVGGSFVFGWPQVAKASILLPEARIIEIETGVDKNLNKGTIKLNSSSFKNPVISFEELTKGAKIYFNN